MKVMKLLISLPPENSQLQNYVHHKKVHLMEPTRRNLETQLLFQIQIQILVLLILHLFTRAISH